MKTSEKIEHAQKRIKELQTLINAWTPKKEEEPQTLQGLRLTKDDLAKLKEVTAMELEEYYSRS